jgi:hypothetical protein
MMELRSELKEYPNLNQFVSNYCKTCETRCEIPSIQMFGCVLKKISEKDKLHCSEKKEETTAMER